MEFDIAFECRAARSVRNADFDHHDNLPFRVIILLLHALRAKWPQWLLARYRRQCFDGIHGPMVCALCNGQGTH
jgi:hypothetical protein